MNTRAIQAIIRKDLQVVTRSKAVMLPIIILPLVFFVILPIFFVALIPSDGLPAAQPAELEEFLAQIPAGLEQEMAGYTDTQKIVVFMLVYMLAPMFLIVPLMVASVIAADSFAGERERKTLEALVYTPTTDLELFTAKTLAAWIPAMIVALLSFIIYAIMVNISAWPHMGRIFFPNTMWLVLVLWVAPATAALGLGTMVLVSSRVKSFQEAYQLGGVVVLPVIMLVVAQATGVMYFNITLVLLLGTVLWLIDALVLGLSVRTFQRGEIIARL